MKKPCIGCGKETAEDILIIVRFRKNGRPSARREEINIAYCGSQECTKSAEEKAQKEVQGILIPF